jgi:hypothetical protein
MLGINYLHLINQVTQKKITQKTNPISNFSHSTNPNNPYAKVSLTNILSIKLKININHLQSVLSKKALFIIS